MTTTIRKQTIARLNQFVQIPNDWARDRRMTFKARGLLLFLSSHVDGWCISVNSLVKDAGEGRQAVEGAIKELEAFGYLVRKQVRNEDGHIVGMEYVLTDPDDPDRIEGDRLGGASDHKTKPVDENPLTGAEDGRNPVHGNPVTGNQHTKKTSSLEDQPQKTNNITPTKRKPKTRMPEGWKPKTELADFAVELGLIPILELDSFKSWTTAGDYLYADWDAAFRNHLIDRGKRLKNQGRFTKSQRAQPAEQMLNILELGAQMKAEQQSTNETRSITDGN